MILSYNNSVDVYVMWSPKLHENEFRAFLFLRKGKIGHYFPVKSKGVECTFTIQSIVLY